MLIWENLQFKTTFWKEYFFVSWIQNLGGRVYIAHSNSRRPFCGYPTPGCVKRWRIKTDVYLGCYNIIRSVLLLVSNIWFLNQEAQLKPGGSSKFQKDSPSRTPQTEMITWRKTISMLKEQTPQRSFSPIQHAWWCLTAVIKGMLKYTLLSLSNCISQTCFLRVAPSCRVHSPV